MSKKVAPCKFDHNGECLICDCWADDCAWERYLDGNYEYESKEELEKMFKMKYAVQAVILNDKGEVLAVSRKDNHYDMGLIGGKVDEGDYQHGYLDPFQAAMKRECKEETGLDIDMEDAVVVFQMHKDGYMGITYLIKSWSGEIKYDEPHVVKWVPFEAIINGSFGAWNNMVKLSLESMGIELNVIIPRQPIIDEMNVYLKSIDFPYVVEDLYPSEFGGGGYSISLQDCSGGLDIDEKRHIELDRIAMSHGLKSACFPYFYYRK